MRNDMVSMGDVRKVVDRALHPFEAFSRICDEFGPGPHTNNWSAEDWRDNTSQVLAGLVRGAQQVFDEVAPATRAGGEAER